MGGCAIFARLYGGIIFLKTKLNFNKYLLYGSKRLFNADKRQPIPLEWSMKITEDRDKWGKYVHGAANPRIDDG